MTEIETVGSLFEESLERYKAGEKVANLIPAFKEVCDRAPKSSAAWACLAWLYMLDDKPSSAYKAAQKAVKLNPQDAQSRVNLALAMLENNTKGVREHIDLAMQLIMIDEEVRAEIKQSIADGFTRKPGWKSLERVNKWLFEV